MVGPVSAVLLLRTSAARKFHSVFSTVFLMCLSCCLLLVLGCCCLYLMMKMFHC